MNASNDIAVLESLVDSAGFYSVFVDRGTRVDPSGLVLASISSQKGDFRPNLVSVLPSLIRMAGEIFFNMGLKGEPQMSLKVAYVIHEMSYPCWVSRITTPKKINLTFCGPQS